MPSLPPVFRPSLVVFLVLCFFSLSGHALSKSQKVQAGEALYSAKGCGYCHGKTAQGTAKGPALTHLGWWRWRGSRIAGQIENGGAKMPAFGDSLTRDEVAELVVWLRSHPHLSAQAHAGK